MDNHAHVLGKKGEKLSCQYLIKKGYQILDMNFKSKMGEIDIVGKRDNKIYFFEVKTRSGLYYGDPIDFILMSQLCHLRKAISWYMKKNSYEGMEMQMDVIEILVQKGKWYIRHTENAVLF